MPHDILWEFGGMFAADTSLHDPWAPAFPRHLFSSNLSSSLNPCPPNLWSLDTYGLKT